MDKPFDSPRLLADVGGTFARFTLQRGPNTFAHAQTLRCADHPSFQSAVAAYIAHLAGLPGPENLRIAHAAVAIATPVEGDLVRMTNYPWQFSIDALRLELGWTTLVVVNDFTALAMALPQLQGSDKRAVGGGTARAHSVVGLLGSGTGLGVSGLIPAGGGWVALGTEGGHTSFAPRDERELAVLQFAWRTLGHVSFERLLSGPGLELIYSALAERQAKAQAQAQTPAPPASLPAPDITRRALAGTDALCAQVLDVFCAILGTAAGNVAVTLGALGGIYIGGGIVPRLGAFFDRSPFRARFEDRGRFSAYLAHIPTWVITAENATFQGVAAILDTQLRSSQSGAGVSLLAHIQRARAALSPAERRVADHVLAHPRALLGNPVADIAKAAQVSQPTVIRFCRSLGCEGLADFKRRLASSLSSSVPLTHTPVQGNDSVLDLAAKVLGNTAGALLQARESLNREAMARAIEMLAQAQRVDCFASGAAALVAADAQAKLLRLGVPSALVTAPAQQTLAAGLLKAGDVALLISHEDRDNSLLALADLADLAQQRGARVLAITTGQSPLARKADVSLVVDHTEDPEQHLPMISRVLQLLMVDIMAVGLAHHRQQPQALAEPGAGPAAAAPGGARSVALGVSAAVPGWMPLSSHSVGG